MANDQIDGLCRAFALLSLHDEPFGAAAQVVNQDNLASLQPQLSQALLRLVKPYHASSQASQMAQLDFDGDTIMESRTTGMLT